MEYNYKREMFNDIMEWVKGHICYTDFNNLDELQDFLNEELLMKPTITGYKGNYYVSYDYTAEEYICHHFDELNDACIACGVTAKECLQNGAQHADFLLRCYYLREVIDDVIWEIADEFEDFHEQRRYSCMEVLLRNCTFLAEYFTDAIPGNDIHFLHEKLYISPDGEFVMHGEGGAYTGWARPCGVNSFCGGNDIVFWNDGTAKEWLQEHFNNEKVEEILVKVKDVRNRVEEEEDE